MAQKRRRGQSSDEDESLDETNRKREVKAKGKPGRKPKNQQVKHETESEEIDEEKSEGSEDEDSFEKIDPRFKQSK